MTSYRWASASALILVALLMAGCGKGEQAKDSAGATTGTSRGPSTAAVASGSAGHSTEPGLKLSAEELQAAGVKVAPLQEQDVNEQVVVTATIQANQDKLARIAPRVGGKVTKVMANLGDKVDQGQPLALIDSIEIGEAQSAYAQALAEHALAKASVERAEKLYADQIIPQKDYLRIRADFEKSKAVLRAANERRQVLGITGQIGSTTTGQSVFAVLAPFAGTIIEKQAVLGELGQSEKPLFSIADLSSVWIETNLYEKDLGKIKTGASAVVTTEAYPGETFKGRVTYISSVMDKESRTVRARVEVPNPDTKLKLEMFATAAIAATRISKALLLPDDAVVLVQGQPTAFVQDASGFEARAVDLGDKLNGKVVLKAGIRPGEKVVTSGAYALKAKMLKAQIGGAG